MATSLGTALITGASSGIGEIYADRLARRGYDLILVGRSAEKLSTLAATLAQRTGRHVERLGADAAITLLVTPAGLIGGGPLSAGNVEAVSQMLAVNITALTRLTTVAAKAFGDRGTGAIVNLASAMAFIDA